MASTLDLARHVLLAAAVTAATLSAWSAPGQAASWAAPTWVAGDAHVHAAGDSGLEPHVRCEGVAGGLAACAENLVHETLLRARQNHAAWVIYTEHGPWLGAKPTDRTFCAPPFGWPCKTVPWFEHDEEQARRQYDAIAAAAARLAPEYGVRALMGQELGTAGHVTIGVSYLEHAPSQIKNWYPGDCAGVEAGHFGVYYTPRLLADTVFDCNESRYLRTVAEAGAWGAVNHPDNEDGGSRWFCWNQGDVSPKDDGPGRDTGEGARCETGVYEKPLAVQAIEIVSDQNMPSEIALRQLDALLLQGRQIALTGGGDSHTAKPEPSSKGFVKLGPVSIPLLPSVSQASGNDAKVGLSGRTYVPAEGIAPVRDFDPTDRADPVREAIRSGRTVASTGPLGLPTIDGKGPGESVDVVGGTVTVRVEFRGAPVVRGDLADPGHQQETRLVTVNGSDESGRVSRINVVIGRSEACRPVSGAVNTPCVVNGENLKVMRHEVTETERDQGYATVTVPVPAGFVRGFLRTETLFSPTERNSRFRDLTEYAHGAFASPIYLRQAADRSWFTGDWHGHSRIGHISADGAAQFVFRDYSQPGLVDITVEARLEPDGSGLAGSVTKTSSAKFPVGTAVRVEPADQFSITVYFGDGRYVFGLCNEHSPPGYCGA